MAIGHESATESNVAANVAFQDVDVPFTANSKGLLILCVSGAAIAGDHFISAKIDPAGANIDVPFVTGARAADTVGEEGECEAYFLGGSSLPTTTTTVRVNRVNNAQATWFVAILVTALTNSSEVYLPGIVIAQGDQIPSQKLVDDGSPGTDSLRYAGAWSGSVGVSVGAQSTFLHTGAIGAGSASTCRETTGGQGSRAVGFTDTLGDDYAAVHLAIRELEEVETPETNTFIIRNESPKIVNLLKTAGY